MPTSAGPPVSRNPAKTRHQRSLGAGNQDAYFSYWSERVASLYRKVTSPKVAVLWKLRISRFGDHRE